MDSDICTNDFISVVGQTASALNVKMDTAVKYEITIKEGFHYESYNPHAHLQAWNILKMVESARAVSWWKADEFQLQSFMDIDRVPRLLFTVAADLQVSEELYDVTLRKRPVTAVSEVNYIGRASFKGQVSLFLPGIEKPIAVSNTQFVFVDPEARKPSPPDSWWLEKYSPLMPADAKPLRIPSLSLPEGTVVWEDTVTVQPSDIDFYMHLNWTNYCRICVNVITLHHARELEDGADPFRNVKSFEINYRGEASMGDVLKIKFWQSVDTEDKYCLLVYKEDKMITESYVVFHPKSDNRANGQTTINSIPHIL